MNFLKIELEVCGIKLKLELTEFYIFEKFLKK